jgi:hypothetical protein
MDVEDLMIEAEERGDDGSYEAVVDTLAALGDDARKARKENEDEGVRYRIELGDGSVWEGQDMPRKESERGDAEPTQAAPRAVTPAGGESVARSEHASALRQLKERIERTMAHAQDTQRWLSADYPPTAEAVWRLTDAQRHLLRARNAVWAAEDVLR